MKNEKWKIKKWKKNEKWKKNQMKNAFKTNYIYRMGCLWASTEFGSEVIEKKQNGSEAIENNNEKQKQIRLAHVLY